MNLLKLLTWFIVIISFSAYGQTSLKEFYDGKRTIYSSLNNSKVKDIEVSFEYPQSWKGENGKRPNVLYQVTSNGGKGLELCNLSFNKLPYNLTPDEIGNLFSPSGFQSFIPDGAKYVDGDKTSIDGQPAAWINYLLDVDRAGIKFRTIWISYPVYFDKKLILFSCGVAASVDKPKEALEKKYKENLPFFQQVALSLVIHSKWNQK